MKKETKLEKEAREIYNSFYWKLYPHTPHVAYVSKQICLLHLTRIVLQIHAVSVGLREGK
jgi:hypothetical protein